jgi:hypothetical protein
MALTSLKITQSIVLYTAIECVIFTYFIYSFFD